MQTVFDQLAGEQQRRLFRSEVEAACNAYANSSVNKEEIARAFFRGVQSSLDGNRPDWCPDDISEISAKSNAFSDGYLFAANVFSSCAVSNDDRLRSY